MKNTFFVLALLFSFSMSALGQEIAWCAPPTKFDFVGGELGFPGEPPRADFSVYRSSENTWYFGQTTGDMLTASGALQWGADGDMLAPADFNADGRTDVAVFRPSTGEWFIRASTLFDFAKDQTYVATFGMSGDLPVPADYDKDGKADVAVYRPSDSTWFILRSSDNKVSIDQFGTSEDRPVPGDFDGDGAADIAVRRKSDNTWHILGSSSGYKVFTWGHSGDTATPADFDGDGKTDIAIFRPWKGDWQVLGSMSGPTTTSWGKKGDIPVPADYDGDRKDDIAIFRPSNGTWYIAFSNKEFSGSGFLYYQFGLADDKPVPSTYAY